MLKFGIFLLFVLVFLVHPRVVEAFLFEQEPTRIIIPSIGRSLPVSTAPVAYNTWEVALDGASFGETTTLPGNEGNTVIFAHALPTRFGLLPKLQQGDLVHVFTEDDWFVYEVQEVLVVEPQNLGVVSRYDGFELTLYTCTGKDYERRFVVKAELVSGS